tara:strand:- start:54 stop:224 length:171 start_codon:yes stop_codon:yes gene_type:complete
MIWRVVLKVLTALFMEITVQLLILMVSLLLLELMGWIERPRVVIVYAVHILPAPAA